MDDITERIAGLSETKRVLLELRLARKPRKVDAKPSISRLAKRDSFPLSFAQQRLWFLDQLEPNSVLYNESIAFRVSGPFNIKAFHKALQAVVDRHEALRTTFVAVDGIPMQVIVRERPVELRSVDLVRTSPSDRDEQTKRLLKEEPRRTFNLSVDLMLRGLLLKLEAEEYILVLVMHHIATDGWSVGVLFQELAALYDAFRAEKPIPLTELPIQYPDFAVWQRQRLAGEVLERELSYWKKQLAGALPSLELPTDRPRPSIQTHHGARQSFLLPKVLSEALQDLGRRERTTLFTVLLAAFKVLLHRYTGQYDVVVGSPIAGRTQAEVQGLIGFFANTLVLRTDLSGNPSFREILARVWKTASEAYAHQELPFEKLVEELQPQRDMSRNPLFQVMFGFSNVGEQTIGLADLSLSPVEVDAGTAKFDLFLSMDANADSVKGLLEYNSDLFEWGTIGRMLGHFQALLQDIVRNPQRRLADLAILTDAERRQLLLGWNDTKSENPKSQCVHELFEMQVDRSPDAIAAVFENQQLTYGELNRRANRLAHYLRKMGVGANVAVGICVERSFEMIVGLLGILKAGGVYVPLDPGFPPERLDFMLQDAQAKFLLTQRSLVAGFPESAGQVIRLDVEWDGIENENTENPIREIEADDTAYVIYTSGSTGKPKGVEITHRAVVNFLTSMREQPGLTERDVLLAVTTIAFDIAGLELYLPLIVGARLVLLGRETVADGAGLSRGIARSRATVMQATPATWRMLIDAGWEGKKELKILCGGEALSRELADALLQRCASLWNLYGPTETTIWSTVHRVEASANSVSIGRPIANTQIYILDRDLQPVPIGVPGELHIGGMGLARGYLNRPQLTREKFINHSFSEDSNERLYKTGDLACYLPDGNIEFLGRFDDQVKIRGFRIELGEVEAVLREHPAVRDCVVSDREDVPGVKRLVGYIVAAGSPAPSTSEFRRFLQEKLPDYMIPTSFTFLAALPMTPNGKVDRRALPKPEVTRPELDAVFVAPQSGIEKILVGIWSRVLGLEHVGVHDNFFDLGGHSLLLAKVHSQLQTALARELPMVDLFRYPTIAKLAKYLSDVPEQDLRQKSADRAERQRAALQNRRHLQAIAERRGEGRRRD